MVNTKKNTKSEKQSLQTNIYNLNESPSSHKKKFNLKDGNTP